ncbi:chorismate mutase [Vibrio sp. SS-MA-C1-2]|uniref:chorismate mutase n=1 Tax=Vibrio sp. SS-MA-C1-2 TaxID=2908646 RepID=UPI001F000EF0|nr:chorismate mutase [Vibrio sp. SS-MA-C1-2]UJF18476.1 chorismate mutase [Vibrio sp. SS-MA-C1-2]
MRKLVLLLITLVSFSSMAQDAEPLDLFKTINERLSYMEDVGAYKTQHNIAIEDRARESVVIEKASESAQHSGLNKDSVKDFFAAQISAAKAIQYRYRADLLSQPLKHTPRDLKTEVRPALLMLGNKINQETAGYLQSGHKIDEQDWTQFEETINVKYLKESDKLALFNALKNITLK